MTTTHFGTIRNGTVEFEEPLTLPEGSQVRVTLSLMLSERKAAAKANVWLAFEVGDAVGVMNGELIHREDCTVWRFGAFITSLRRVPVGPIGHVEVNADTGTVLNSLESAEAMFDYGRQLIATT